MSELSVFVDESGDLGGVSNYYLVTLVFHDQNDAIVERIDATSAPCRSPRFPIRLFMQDPY